MTRIRNQYWQTGFFLLIVLIALLTVRHYQIKENQDLARTQAVANAKIIAAQLQACERGGILRAQVNYDTDLIRTFMLEAVKATKVKPGKAAAIRAASYQRLANGLLDVSQPDCQGIYHPN